MLGFSLARLFSLSLALLLLVVAWLTWGFYFEDNTNIVVAIFYGYISAPPASLWISDYYTFLLPVIGWFCEKLPNIPVFGILWAVQLLVCLAAMILFVSNRMTQLPRGWRLALLAATLLMCTELLSHHIVRFSIIASFMGLLLFHERLRSGDKPHAIDTLLFMMGLWARMHSGIIMLAFFMAYEVLLGRGIVATLRAHRWHITASVMLLTVYQLHGVLTTNMGEVIEANYEYALLEKERMYPLADMRTHADSVRHAALQGFLLSDSAQFTQEFFDRAVDLRYYNDTFTSERLNHVTNELRLRINEQWPLYMAWALLLLSGVALLGLRHTDMRAALIASGLFWAVILALLLVLVDEMKPRFIEPFAGMVIFLLLLRLIPALAKVSNGFSRIAICTAGITGLLMFRVTELNAKAGEYRKHDFWALKAQEQFRTCTAPYRVMGFTHADVPFAYGVFHRHQQNPYARLGFFDGGYLVYFPHFKRYFSDLFGCSPVDYPCILELLRTQDDIRFYAVPDRLELVANYFEGMYGTKLTFSEDSSVCDFGLNGCIFTVRVENL